MKKRSINIKSFIRNNTKVIISFVIGFVLASGVVYASTAIYSKDIAYDNSKSGISSTNLQGAIDELYTKAKNHCPDGYICKLAALEVGDYVKMTPSKTSYTIDTSKTGCASQTINPSELNIWRVIKKIVMEQLKLLVKN